MDGDLTAALESVLSDPEKMEKVANMAKDLFGGAAPASPANAADKAGESGSEAARPAGLDATVLSKLGRAFAGEGLGKSRSTALLMAMRPYMKPEKQEKLDRAMQIARMANIAGLVMNQYGGGGHGV